MESLESKLFSKSWKPTGGLLEVPRLINYEDALEILKEAQQVSVEPEVKPACEWILVKDRLPEVDERVLVYVEDYHIDRDQTNTHKILFGYLRGSGKIKPDGCLGDFNVTKWMPIPKP